MSNHDERMRILRLVEHGQISAEEASGLIDALESDSNRNRTPTTSRPRSLRVIVTDLSSRRQKINVAIPVSLIGVGLKLGARFFPRSTDLMADDIRRAIETGEQGRIFELQDLEEQERIEILIEH
jgi:hypothetical protein